jgi:5-methylcytosine-specific restriction endonuclease McrA
VSNEPPSPGRWGGAGSYYRIPLSNFQAWPTPLPLRRLIEDYGNELLADLTQHSPKFYPFNRFGGWVRTVQGIYLARATPALIGLIRSALSIEADWAAAGQTSPGAAVGEWHREYAEGMRKQREAYFFARNPRLAADAKAHHGSCCQACGFDFASRYGALGAGYAECHHLSPLSERPENGWTVELRTKLEDVAVLCANCHRMVHRRRPALSLDELTATIRGGITPSQTAQHRIHLRPLHASKVVQKAQDEGVSDGVA